MDFAGIEIQTLDTTGTVWPERQRFLVSRGELEVNADSSSTRPFGINWKMSAKTILVQLLHKVTTFEHLQKNLILVLQDDLLAYMESEFSFGHLSSPALSAEALHFHSYEMLDAGMSLSLQLKRRLSTDQPGMAQALGLQAEARVELENILAELKNKLPQATQLNPF